VNLPSFSRLEGHGVRINEKKRIVVSEPQNGWEKKKFSRHFTINGLKPTVHFCRGVVVITECKQLISEGKITAVFGQASQGEDVWSNWMYASLDCAVHTHCLSRLCSTHTVPL